MYEYKNLYYLSVRNLLLQQKNKVADFNRAVRVKTRKSKRMKWKETEMNRIFLLASSYYDNFTCYDKNFVI